MIFESKDLKTTGGGEKAEKLNQKSDRGAFGMPGSVCRHGLQATRDTEQTRHGLQTSAGPTEAADCDAYRLLSLAVVFAAAHVLYSSPVRGAQVRLRGRTP